MKTSAARERGKRIQRTCRLCGHEGDDVRRTDLMMANGHKQTIPVCETCRKRTERENDRVTRQYDERMSGRAAAQRAREAYRRQGRS